MKTKMSNDMKTYLECVKQAASIRGLKGAIKQLYFKLPQELIETLKEAADMYATQSNSHKHSVSGKRPMLTEIQIVQAMAAVDEARQKLEALLAACASGAVDKTVSEGHDETHVTIRDGEFDWCMACNKQVPRA